MSVKLIECAEKIAKVLEEYDCNLYVYQSLGMRTLSLSIAETQTCDDLWLLEGHIHQTATILPCDIIKVVEEEKI